tara:strand:+ start:114 stop:815 length:702 start_codon:yes stop_codon:yes gene_type:complete
MSDKTISRRGFLKGLGATVAAAATTGVPIKTGPDKLTTMSNAVKSLTEKRVMLRNQLTALDLKSSSGFKGGYSAFLTDMVKNKEIPKAFADKARKAFLNTEKRRELKLVTNKSMDKVKEERNKKLASLREYASKKHPSVFIMGSGEIQKLKKGQRLESYKGGRGETPVISTPESRLKQKQKQQTRGGRGGGGKSATGLGIKTPAGPSPRTKLKMLSKGGYMNPIKIVDNRKNK